MAKRVALALGSGGARGYAHIGVINELRDRGYDIVGIAGSSMGALVGGLQAAGSLDGFADWAKTLTQRAVLRLLDPSISAAGVLRAGKILDAVRDILGDATIEGLPIPYTAVATDLIAGKSVWLQHGPVDAAIRASIAIPGVIAPHVLDGRLLADGGILDPLPMAPISAVNADLTIAVSVSGAEADAGDDQLGGDTRPTRERLNRLLRSTSPLFDRLGTAAEQFDIPDTDAEDNETDDELGYSARGLPKLGSFTVMMRSIDIAQAASRVTRWRPTRLTCSSRCPARPTGAWTSTGPPRSSRWTTRWPPRPSTASAMTRRSSSHERGRAPRRDLREGSLIGSH